MMIWTIIIGIIIGMWWYPVIEGLMEALSTKSMKELEKLAKEFEGCKIQNRFILILAWIFRAPLFIPTFILLYIHYTKLYLRESK